MLFGVKRNYFGDVIDFWLSVEKKWVCLVSCWDGIFGSFLYIVIIEWVLLYLFCLFILGKYFGVGNVILDGKESILCLVVVYVGYDRDEDWISI